MLRTLFHAVFYWAPALLICAVVGARAAAPFPYGSADYTQTLTESLIKSAHELSGRSNLYVKVGGADPSVEMLADLNSRKLPLTFAPWSARSPKQDHCRALGEGATANAICMADNFLAADLLSMPLWHVALVRVKTAACTAEMTLVQGSTLWHVVSQRTNCP